MVYDYFPPLHALRHKLAGYCSGGDLQMMAIGRALIAHPKLLLLDDPSLGLAPYIVRDIFRILRRINRDRRATILLVEQNANMALQIAHYGYVMENGTVVLEGEASDLSRNPDVREFYLGVGASGALKDYTGFRSYKKRKRWL